MLTRVQNIVLFDKKRIVCGCILALLICLPCILFYSWKAGVVFFACAITVGTIKIQINRSYNILRLGWYILAIVGTCFSSQILVGAGMLWSLEVKYIFLEIRLIGHIY